MNLQIHSYHQSFKYSPETSQHRNSLDNSHVTLQHTHTHIYCLCTPLEKCNQFFYWSYSSRFEDRGWNLDPSSTIKRLWLPRAPLCHGLWWVTIGWAFWLGFEGGPSFLSVNHRLIRFFRQRHFWIVIFHIYNKKALYFFVTKSFEITLCLVQLIP
jgi:hypothetical protein